MVWFQNYKIDEPNYAWSTRMYQGRKERWYKEARESARKALKEYLDSLWFERRMSDDY